MPCLMSARSKRLTVDTVSGSFSTTSTLDPSRVVTLRVLPSSAAMVPRILVTGAFCATAVAAHRHAASASGNRRANMVDLPLVVGFPAKDGDDPGFGKRADRLS